METCCSRFTAAEGGARLAAAAGEKNILVVEYASFISTRLVHEDAYKIRGLLSSGRQRTVYVSRASRVACVAYELQIMTDLKVVQGSRYDACDWSEKMEENEVLICTSEVLRGVLSDGVLDMSTINVLIIDSCHLVCSDDNLKFIMKQYKQSDVNKRPRILALTYPLFSSPKKETPPDPDSVDHAQSQNEERNGQNDENGEVDSENDKNEEVDNKNDEVVDKNEKSGTKNDKNGEIDNKNDEVVAKNEESDTKNEEISTKKEDVAKNEETITKTEEIDIKNIETDDKNEEINTENIDTDCKCEESDAKIENDVKNDVTVRNEIFDSTSENLDDFDMYEKLEWKIEELERELCCEMDLAEDIDGGKRLSGSLSKPKELIIEFSGRASDEELPEAYLDVDKFMRESIKDAVTFLDEHRYDPTEIYGEDLYEEFKSIPDPAIEPKVIFNQFLYILNQLGPYAADKAAFSLLAKLEKLKIKVPYERHFLLLCLCTTVFIKIRCYADLAFSKYDSDWEKIKIFSTPKVHRFTEILQKFQPTELKHNNDITSRMMSELDKCDFTTLGNKIEDRVNTYEANLKELDGNKTDSDGNRWDSAGNDVDCAVSGGDNGVFGRDKSDSVGGDGVGFRGRGMRRSGGSWAGGSRARGRARAGRGGAARAALAAQSPDALYGLVFVRYPLVAKILFMLIVDMSRAHPSLSHLCAQYCAVETPADPATEAKEAQRQAKKQEEVLKKFRMHECNLLLATSALEEGIDLPRCNLVLRWDVPQSYRSYGLCRGRARAVRAACGVLCGTAPDATADLLHNLAVYKEIDQIISRKCGCGIQDEPPSQEEDHADRYSLLVKAYTPQDITKDIKNNLDSKNNDDIKLNDSKKTSDKNIADRNGLDCNELQSKLENLQISNCDSLKNAKGQMPDSVNVNTHCKNICEEVSADREMICENKVDSDVNSLDSVRTDNLLCNRCNSVRISVRVECPCVKFGNIDVRNKVDSKERDRKTCESEMASVDLSTAIALINRYCGKLPSDTFTRLAPQWWMEEVLLPVPGTEDKRKAYVCTLRLPLNCPVKYNIVGHPMPTRVLARRIVALQACRILHKSGELDNQLMPIGKENFKAAELDANNVITNDASDLADAARPGTTKRRQYYFKRTAWAFTDCQPVVDANDSDIDPSSEAPPAQETQSEPVKKGTKRNMLYAIVSKLWCALPERYNTRGRRLHAPQHASQAIGILMARDQPDDLQIPSFPVYTRSGEVRVSVEHVPNADVRLSPRRGRLVRRFMRFVFASVLRVRRRGMKLQSEGSTHNNYYIVPTIKTIREDGSTKIDIDWAFLELIYQHTEENKNSEMEKPLLWQQDEEDEEEPMEKVERQKETEGGVKVMENPLLSTDETFAFAADQYREAVVTPWYRNQDQPQFFLVAEICWNLSPDSAFPSAAHTSFREYYHNKYGVVLTQPKQPLLDVDHTSARLNLLTPRYVNRKGVALPVSSERTRRAKRDRLDQKQILVPELCRVHPFAAPLWFATVALPCVLYRINALLIADEIRRAVAIDVGLGIPKIDEKTCPGFHWPPLDFGWSLAEVLSADSEKNEKKKEADKIEENNKDSNGDEKERESENESEKLKEKTINDILAEKEDAESGFEIGTWSNEMASSIPDSEYDEFMEPLPSNLTFCTSASGGTNWCDPIDKPKSQYNPSRTFSMAESDCSYMSSDFDTDDSDLNTDSDEEADASGFGWSKNSMGVRIEYKTAHEAEAVDVEKKRKTKPQPQPDVEDDDRDRRAHRDYVHAGRAPDEYIEKFRASVQEHEKDILTNGNLIKSDQPIADILPETKDHRPQITLRPQIEILQELFPYGKDELTSKNGQITLESIEKNKRVLLNRLKDSMSDAEIKKLNCFSMVDVDIDSPSYVNEKVANVGFDTKENYAEKISRWDTAREFKPYYQEGRSQGKQFDFDYQPVLEGHPGPSPSVILQALTMSNANDGINLERLETVGDSFLKFAITAYLYAAHPTVHEGKLSHMRSKQVSNLNLYRLGRGRRLGARMIASKFEPHDNWLPPCHRPPRPHTPPHIKGESKEATSKSDPPVDGTGCFIPYNLITQHSIPDKSIADCVEALIGAYLLECGPRGALVFMSWLGIRVLPRHDLPLPDDHPYVQANNNPNKHNPSPPASPRRQQPAVDSDTDCSSDSDEPWAQEEELAPEQDWSWSGRPVGSLRPYQVDGIWYQPIFGELKAPPSPLLRYISDPEGELEQMLSGYDALERTLQYRFKDRSLLLQALTHASHQKNRLTDCYQRLEFLGDAILDYLITRHLYEDARRHSPGALTDLRSALVNNTIFATLAAKHGFHKYFRHMSPGLNEVLTRYVKIQEENGHSISEEHYLIQEDEMEQAEDVEVPKALGDLFESVAGAIFLDSGMSLGAVWASYVRLMGAELEAFSAAAPKSPVRELLEAEPDTAKFGKPERLADGRRVRVCVEVFGRGAFKGVGRNYRIAKGTAARCALRHLRALRPR